MSKPFKRISFSGFSKEMIQALATSNGELEAIVGETFRLVGDDITAINLKTQFVPGTNTQFSKQAGTKGTLEIVSGENNKKDLNLGWVDEADTISWITKKFMEGINSAQASTVELL